MRARTPSANGRKKPRSKASRQPALALAPVSPPFDSATFLAWLGRGKSSQKVKSGDALFHQGDAADSVFYLDKGKVQVSVESKQGKTAIVASLGRGDFFGEGCLAGQARRMTTATVTAAGAVTRIQKKAMVRLLHERPDLSESFVAYLLARNIQIEEDLVDQMFNSSERRLARLLVLLANFAKEGEFETVLPKISQETLAARVGTTRSRINYFMNKFRRLGYIEYNGHLKVHTSLLNVVVHD